MSNAGAGPHHLSAAEIRAELTMAAAVDAVGAALEAVSRGEVEQPPRLVLGGGRVLVMAATHAATGDTVVKTVSVSLDRRGRAPSIEGTVVWLDGATGQATFTADGAEITALRTGAVSGLATRMFARDDARRLTVLGSGRQAATQAEAVCAVRPIEQVTVFSRTPANARAFARRLLERASHLVVIVADDAEDAVAGADVVCCATSAHEPLFRTSSLPESVHVNAVGSYRANMSELPPDLLTTASVVAVDDLAGCLEESGEVIAALAAGLDVARLRPLGAGPPGAERTGDRPGAGRTVFKSVGCAALDWAVASTLAARLPALLP